MNATTLIYTSFLTAVRDQNVTTIPFADVVKAIKTEQYLISIAEIRNEPDEIKKKALKRKLLPVFFPTLVLGSENILDDSSFATGIVQFDVDLKDNLSLDFNALRQQLIRLRATFYVFSSPSGGLKFGIRTDFVRYAGESIYSLNNRFLQAYALTKDYVTSTIVDSDSVKFDNNMKALKYSCYLSSDVDIYFNADSELITLDEKCIYTPIVPSAFTNHPPVSIEKLEDMLKCIPPDLGNEDRFLINISVLAEFGSAGISILMGHWRTSDKVNLQSDLRSQLTKVSSGAYKVTIGLLISIATLQYGWKPSRAKRSPNKNTAKLEPVNHDFPALPSEVDIYQLLVTALDDTEHDAHLFRISTGAGKSEKLTDVLSGLKRQDWYLVICDTNQNIDEQVKKINDYFDAKTVPIGKLPDKGYIPRYANFEHSCAAPLKGKFIMCNRMKSDIDFKEKYTDSGYFPPAECNKCWEKENGSCNYWNQADPVVDGHFAPNIYLTHYNTLYNETSELFKDVMPVEKEVVIFDDPDDLTNDKYSLVTKVCKPIKAIIVDENAIQYNNNGYLGCIIPNNAPGKLLTPHKLILDIFNLAYKGLNLDLSVAEVKQMRLIYGDELKAFIDQSVIGFNARQLLKSYKIALKKSDKTFSDKTDVYLNLLQYLTTNNTKFLFGMRIKNGGLTQGNIKKIKDRFADTKLIYFDATMNMDLVADAILPSKCVEKTSIDVKMKDDIHIHQLNGKKCSKSALGKNSNVLHVLNHAKQFIADNGLQDAKGGLITFQKLIINGVEDEAFVDTAAKVLWGDNYESTTSNQTRYFGNTRGYNGMKECDYLVIIGDYNLPPHILDSHHWNLYGEPANMINSQCENFNRMADGSCIKTHKKQYHDSRTQGIYEHFCIAELEQALGRGRLIYGSAKKILVYTSMPLGSNVEITSFIDAANVFPRQIISDEVMERIKSTGFVQKKRKDILAATGLSAEQWKKDEDDIINNFLAARFVEQRFSYIKSRNKVSGTYLVFDAKKFKAHTLVP
jgi:hypothetical protein